MKNTFFLIAFVCLSWASIAQHNHSDHDSHKQHKDSGPTFNENKIANPYFGNMMLTCGSVKEIIE